MIGAKTTGMKQPCTWRQQNAKHARDLSVNDEKIRMGSVGNGMGREFGAVRTSCHYSNAILLANTCAAVIKRCWCYFSWLLENSRVLETFGDEQVNPMACVRACVRIDRWID